MDKRFFASAVVISYFQINFVLLHVLNEFLTNKIIVAT